MDLKELKKLIQVFENSSVHEIEIEEDGRRIQLRKEKTHVLTSFDQANPSTHKETLSVVENANDFVLSPLVGSFYTAANPQAKPYIEVGQKVKEGDVICLVEAMKVMNEIKSPKDGVIKAILVENASMVEFHQRLIELEV